MVAPWKKRVASLTARVLEFFGGPRIGGGLKRGSRPPELKLDDWINRPESLIDYSNSGNGLFLEFWSTQCPPCVESVPKIRRLYGGYQGCDLRFLTVHVDLHEPPASDDKIQQFVTAWSIEYPVGIDRSGDLWNRFSFSHLPHGLLFDNEGKVAWSGSLFTHDLEKILTKYYGAPADVPDPGDARSEDNPALATTIDCEGGVCRIPGADDSTQP